MDKNPIHLTILRRGDVHIVDLAEVQAVIPRSETRVESGFLDEIGQELKRITNLVGPEFRKGGQAGDPEVRRNPRVVAELKNVGSLIFSHLLPQAARDRLRSSESCNLYLRLDDQLIHIPWELAFDGQQFLGMKFKVGRQVITHHKVSQVTPTRIASGELKVLIISDPSETLKNVSAESEQLCAILDRVPGFQVRLIGGRGVRRIPLLAALRESDVVHFAGHSQFDEKNPENSGWLLYDGLLTASEISKLDQAPSLVFSNSCQAGATKNWQGDYLFEGEAFGLGSAFLLAGVRNYVGTFCVVHDEESRFLAVEFYRRIAQGQTIGQALLDARLATAEEMGLDRLTWASYMLYGDPALSLNSVQAVADVSSSAPLISRQGSDVTLQKSQLLEKFGPPGSPGKSRPAISHKGLAWLSGSLFAVVLLGFLFFMLGRPTKVIVEPAGVPPLPAEPVKKKKDPGLEVAREHSLPPAIPASRAPRQASQAIDATERPSPPTRPESKTEDSKPIKAEVERMPAVEAPPVRVPPVTVAPKPRLLQDLTDIQVEVDHLQVSSEQRLVVVFLKILNKSAKDLAVALGERSDANFVTDNKGSSYQQIGLSGIGQGIYGWTYVPASAVHTISLRFYGSNARPQRDSVYSISAEAILAPRDDVERFGKGRYLQSSRTVNISIHGIQPD
jgi:hypothetical protein